MVVTVSFQALIKSGDSQPGFGQGPMPRRPFSVCKSILTSEGRNFGMSVGIPPPRFTYIPGFISFAALAAIRSRISFCLRFLGSLGTTVQPRSSTRFSTLFYKFDDLITLSTQMPGRCTSSGSRTPGSTISSTSQIVSLAARAKSGLKLRAVLLNRRFPFVSATYALITATSAYRASS